MNDEQGQDDKPNGPAPSTGREGVTPSTTGPPRKTADRPHWVTIVLGLLSPALAVVALVFSAQSLETSRTSIRIDKRAYLAIRNGQIRRSEVMPQILRAGDPMPLDRNRLWFQWGFEIHNLGQTPASSIEYTTRFDVPSGWKILQLSRDRSPEQASDNTVGEVVGHLEQETHIDHLHDALFELTDEAMERWRSVHTDETLRLHGVLKFRDVFNDPQEITWCWEENPAEAPKNPRDEEMRDLGHRPATECPRTASVGTP